MAKLSNEKIRQIVDDEFAGAMGRPGGEIARERALMLDYYNSEPRGDEVEGEPQLVTTEVADVVDGIMPSLVRMFTSAENLVQFDPFGMEDVEGAKQESDYVSHIFFKKNPAFMILYTWFFDALLQLNGFVQCWWDDSEKVTTERYEGLTEREFLELVSDDELEIVERDERDTDEGKVFDVKFTRTTKEGVVRVENFPPEEFRISPDARGAGTESGRMRGRERLVKRSTLLEMGFDPEIVDEIPADGDHKNTEQATRYNKSDDSDEGNEDRSQDDILLREGYMNLDIDGDGKSEFVQIFTAGGKYLEHTEVDRDPYHSLTGIPIPHKFFGKAYAGKAKDLQEWSTTFLRMIQSNALHVGNPGHAVWEQAIGENTMDDLLTTRLGSVKRFARPVSESYQPITVPFTAGETFPIVEYIDKLKRDRTGIHADSEGLNPDSLKNIQQSVLMQALDTSRGKIELVARIFAETGIKSLFLHIHELVLKHQQKRDIFELRNQFVQVNPSEWRTRKDMTVNIGLGIGTKEQNLLHLNNIWEKQAQMVEAGGMNLTVLPQNIYNTAVEMAKNADFKNPDMFFTNPQNQPAPPPSDEQQQLQMMQLQIQQRQQELDAERQRIEQAKLQLKAQEDAARHQRELQKIESDFVTKTAKLQADNEKARADMAKIAADLAAARDMAPIEQAAAIADIEKTIAETRKTAAETQQTVEETEATKAETAAVEAGVNRMLSDAEAE